MPPTTASVVFKLDGYRVSVYVNGRLAAQFDLDDDELETWELTIGSLGTP